jgi:hypothetical protein
MPYEAKMARMVLEDCRCVLAEMRDDPQGAAWRVRWFCCLAMVKTVEDALYQVDAQREDAQKRRLIKKAIDQWRPKTLKEPDPPIYWEFILKERNYIVHYYKQRAKQSVIVRPGVKKYDLRTGQEETVARSDPTTTDYKMPPGPFEDQAARKVVQEAIEWWDQQLTTIEANARALAGGSGHKSSP